MLEIPQERLVEIKTKRKASFCFINHIQNHQTPLGFRRSYLKLDLYLEKFHKN